MARLNSITRRHTRRKKRIYGAPTVQDLVSSRPNAVERALVNVARHIVACEALLGQLPSTRDAERNLSELRRDLQIVAQEWQAGRLVSYRTASALLNWANTFRSQLTVAVRNYRSGLDNLILG